MPPPQTVLSHHAPSQTNPQTLRPVFIVMSHYVRGMAAILFANSLGVRVLQL